MEREHLARDDMGAAHERIAALEAENERLRGKVILQPAMVFAPPPQKSSMFWFVLGAVLVLGSFGGGWMYLQRRAEKQAKEVYEMDLGGGPMNGQQRPVGAPARQAGGRF